MKILFLNGSPKGKRSVTIQTAEYLKKRFPNFEYENLNIGQQIKLFEKDFSKVLKSLESADIIIFCYPVYTFIAPYQVHSFIELLKSQNIDLSDKYLAQISTSKHFYDVTAHKFIEENGYDLKMRYLGGLSADMDDLQTEKGRFQADCFFEKILFDIENGIYKERKSAQIFGKIPEYVVKNHNCDKKSDKDIVIVTNVSDDDTQLLNMIQDFKNACTYNVREINVRKFAFRGGCVGCMNCSISEKCIYPDNFEDLLRNEIQSADGIINAFSIENHYTHSSMKCYDDRQFCNGHRTVTTGKVTGYIISGHYSLEENLRMIVEGRSQVSGMYSCGVASDEDENSVLHLAKTLEYALVNNISQPQNFYGVGGFKIFRDLVYLMQGLMQADHKFYKEHGYYDFPHNKKAMLWGMKFLGLAMKSPAVQKEMQKKMSEYIIKPYEKILEETVAKI